MVGSRVAGANPGRFWLFLAGANPSRCWLDMVSVDSCDVGVVCVVFLLCVASLLVLLFG